MKRISIKDIAERAGVAPSTVSCVINGKAKERRISDRVAKHIIALAKEVDYQPNPMAVSLRTGKSRIIGLIVEDISNAFFATLAKTIEDKAYSLGYRIVYCSTENDDDKGNGQIKMLLHQHVDGFLIAPTKGMHKNIAELLKNHKPVVLVDRFFPDVKVPHVLVDNYGGVKTGVEHLIQKKYSRIAFVTVDLDQIQMHQREQAYRDTIKSHKLKYAQKLLLKLPFHQPKQDSVKQIAAFIRKNTEIDAVFFATNYLGIYGLESISLLNLSIPGDIAVVCFDDHDIFRIFNPGITIIAQPIEEIAKTSIEMLINRIEGTSVQVNNGEIIKKTMLVVRKST
ncbi:MAG TPA: substrate-binding domain-containing protein [Flavitalea sp.]|nr:substrate-binding domain-containing protein [Flavitalea sp.]